MPRAVSPRPLHPAQHPLAAHGHAAVHGAAPPLDEEASAQEFKEEEKALALGQACINCHGPEGQGGLANPSVKDVATGFTQVPAGFLVDRIGLTKLIVAVLLQSTPDCRWLFEPATSGEA